MLFLPSGGRWEPIYSGAQREHVCDHLRPGTSYRLRVSCASKGGESQVSSRRRKGHLETISVYVLAKCFMSVLCNVLYPWQASDVTTVTTAAVPPGPCPAPALVGKAKPKEITLQWGKHHQSWSKTLL